MPLDGGFIIKKFKDLRIVDNFYQTSSFFPMPVVIISTLNDEGKTNLGPYSLIFPYYIAGKDYYSMLLLCRNNSNTAINILKNKRCTINFISDKKKWMKQCVEIGFPGDTTDEKMANCSFGLQEGLLQKEHPEIKYPLIVEEAFQVYECCWDDSLESAERFKVADEYLPPYNDFNGITSPMGAHFILRIDKVLMKEPWYSSIINGVYKKGFPKVPVDYGYRDNTRFWFSAFKRPWAAKIPKSKATSAETIHYAANRIDPDISFSLEACQKMIKIPRPFIKAALDGCIKWAKNNDVNEIGPAEMDQIRDKRSQEKKG